MEKIKKNSEAAKTDRRAVTLTKFVFFDLTVDVSSETFSSWQLLEVSNKAESRSDEKLSLETSAVVLTFAISPTFHFKLSADVLIINKVTESFVVPH